ncbi:FadR/GntR family transcriptional regulator [Streptomyces sp. NPDC002577]
MQHHGGDGNSMSINPVSTPSAPAESGGLLFRPARPRRAFDEIITQIRALIQQGKLNPGDRLPAERALAEQFSVSRNTVREALRMLEISGLVVLKRGAAGGAFIAEGDSSLVAKSLSDALQLTDFSIADVTETLRGLSSVVTRAACRRMTDADLERLAANVALAEKLTQEQQWERKVGVHLQFHAILAEATGNPVLVLLTNTLFEVVGEVILQVGPTQDDSIIRSRRRVMRSLRKRDADAAIAELERYFERLHLLWLRGDYRGARRISSDA